jgi:hypothetical protein
MNDFDPKLLEKLKKLENLAEIETRLIRQEKKARMTLIVGIILAVFAFTVLLGCILNPAWLPLGH